MSTQSVSITSIFEIVDEVLIKILKWTDKNHKDVISIVSLMGY